MSIKQNLKGIIFRRVPKKPLEQAAATGGNANDPGLVTQTVAHSAGAGGSIANAVQVAASAAPINAINPAIQSGAQATVMSPDPVHAVVTQHKQPSADAAGGAANVSGAVAVASPDASDPAEVALNTGSLAIDDQSNNDSGDNLGDDGDSGGNVGLDDTSNLPDDPTDSLFADDGSGDSDQSNSNDDSSGDGTGDGSLTIDHSDDNQPAAAAAVPAAGAGDGTTPTPAPEDTALGGSGSDASDAAQAAQDAADSASEAAGAAQDALQAAQSDPTNQAAAALAQQAAGFAQQAQDAANQAAAAAAKVPPDVDAAQNFAGLAATADDNANEADSEAQDALSGGASPGDLSGAALAGGTGSGSTASATAPQDPSNFSKGTRKANLDKFHTWSDPVRVEYGNYYVLDPSHKSDGHPGHHYYQVWQAVPNNPSPSSGTDPGAAAATPVMAATPAAGAPFDPTNPANYSKGARKADLDRFHTWTEPVHVEYGNYYVLDPSHKSDGHPGHHYYQVWQAVPNNQQHASIFDEDLTKSRPVLGQMADDNADLKKLSHLSPEGGAANPAFPASSTYPTSGAGAVDANPPAQPLGGWTNGTAAVPPDPANNVLAVEKINTDPIKASDKPRR